MNTRQEKVSKQIQRDIAEIISRKTSGSHKGLMLTVTNVRITPDLGQARIHISVFPSDRAQEVILELNEHVGFYRNELGRKLRYQLKKMPEVKFFLDDSLDYIENIDNLLKE